MSEETPQQRATRLSEEDKRALEWLSKMWTQPRQCPVCGHSAWEVGTVFEVRQFEGGDIVLGGNSSLLPLTSIACGNCGYTFFMNALKSGAIAPPEAPLERTL